MKEKNLDKSIGKLEAQLSKEPEDKRSKTVKALIHQEIRAGLSDMDDLQVEKSHFWGWSMGTYLGYRLVRHYPHRFHSFVLGGAMLSRDVQSAGYVRVLVHPIV